MEWGGHAVHYISREFQAYVLVEWGGHAVHYDGLIQDLQ